MTDYQKKKFIDLGLIIIGIICVGLFLRTQLSHPIIFDYEETTEAEQMWTTLTGNYHEDDENPKNVGVADIKSLSVTMDLAYIDVVIELRELPEMLPMQENAYNWSIYFDVNADDTEKDDILIEHKNNVLLSRAMDHATANDDVFTTTIKRLKKDEIEILGVGESAVDGNMLLIRVPNSKKLGINEKTRYKVILSHQIDNVMQRDEMPHGN